MRRPFAHGAKQRGKPPATSFRPEQSETRVDGSKPVHAGAGYRTVMSQIKESKKKQELPVLSSAGFLLQGCRIDTGAHDPRSFVALADNVFEKELRFVP